MTEFELEASARGSTLASTEFSGGGKTESIFLEPRQRMVQLRSLVAPAALTDMPVWVGASQVGEIIARAYPFEASTSASAFLKGEWRGASLQIVAKPAVRLRSWRLCRSDESQAGKLDLCNQALLARFRRKEKADGQRSPVS